MKATLNELIEGIGYSTIEVTIETPIAKSNFVMEIDHVSKAEHGYYVEAEDGCFLELSEDVDIILEGKSYYVSKDDCYICIKTNT